METGAFREQGFGEKLLEDYVQHFKMKGLSISKEEAYLQLQKLIELGKFVAVNADLILTPLRRFKTDPPD